jgi:hypothetical protein
MTHIGQMLAGIKQAERARDRRRSYPIHMYVGRNGAGKSLAAVYDTLPDLEAGRPCLSTVRLLDYKNPRVCDDWTCEDSSHNGANTHMAAHPLYVPFTQWGQLLEWTSGSVLMDEITGVADSNESSALPVAAANKLAQLRRDDCTVRITGLNFIRANKRIREAVNAVTRCRSSWPVDARAEDGSQRIWRQRRLARYDTYDAQSLPVDDHTEHAYEVADLLLTGRLWIPGCEAIQAYDSLDKVLVVGTVSEAGRCAHCGGTRRNPECACPDYQEVKAAGRGNARRSRSVEDVGASADSLPAPLDGVSSSTKAPIGV